MHDKLPARTLHPKLICSHTPKAAASYDVNPYELPNHLAPLTQ